jgi:adenylate kinase
MTMIVTVFGAPGAGKGTQTAQLKETLTLGYLATGDMLRAAAAAGGPEAEQLEQFASSGHLAPDDFIADMVFRRLDDFPDGLILDGFPRTVVQAAALDEELARRGERLTAAVLLDVSDDVATVRLLGRMTCPTCGQGYHTQFAAPKTAGICDRDATALVSRADDTPQKVAVRLRAYHEQTEPLVGYYAQSGRLLHVDGTQSTADVQRELLDALA